ncbi:MAG: tetratricopeptide repeat protein [Fuerstiella sp.]|nr:tetratricopeptide repeat protein [Fuerstiella sp.]MCP4784190.1 tetratricopeptide repeat protein [Fuerstiella sp.]MCP4858940.1 tetratricopeptide repeat protein [Fuerstiella sp.]
MRNQPLSVRASERVDRLQKTGQVGTASTLFSPRTAMTVTLCIGLTALSGCYSMNGYVMNASGHAYYDQGNYSMAAREFQTALASRPTNPDYMANLAKTRMKMGDNQAAEQLYRQALTASPSHQPSYHGLSELMLAQGRGEESLRLMNTWAATQPYTAEPHVELAWLQREMGHDDAAAHSLQAALQVNPNHPTALAHLGQYYQDSGQAPQAISMYQKSLRANWNQPEVHSRLASAAEAAGPTHPMSRTAMARGVHPQTLPRQQLAFGRPNPAMPFAGGPLMPPPHVAYQPQMMAQQPPLSGPYGPPTATPQPGNPIAMTGFNPLMPAPLGTTGLPGSSAMATPMTAVSKVPEVSSDDVPLRLPVPDTEFAAGSGNPSVPVLPASHADVVDDEAVPEVEAF